MKKKTVTFNSMALNVYPPPQTPEVLNQSPVFPTKCVLYVLSRSLRSRSSSITI